MARDLQKELMNRMERADFNIRNSSHSKIDVIKLEINKVKELMKNGDSSQETKDKLKELEDSLRAEESLAYDRD